MSVDASDAAARLRLTTDGAPGRVEVFALEDPPRLVIDLLDLREANPPQRVPVGGPVVSQLRVGRHADKVRVVADTATGPHGLGPVTTEARPDGLVVAIGSAVQTAAIDRLLAPSTQAPLRAADEAATPTAQQARRDLELQPTSPIHLELEAGSRRIGGSLPDGMRASRSWQRTRASGALATLDGSAPGTLHHDRIRLSFLDDRIRLVTRYARSRSDAPESFATRSSLYESDLERLFAPAGVIGEAFSGRLDGTLLRWDPAQLDAFATYQRVDPLFEWGEGARTDPFAKSNHRALGVGARIRGGPFALSLSRISEQAAVEDPRVRSRPRRWSHRAVLSASLDPLRQLAAGADASYPWALFPDSAWISATDGRIEADAAHPDGATTRDLGAGLSWAGDLSSTTLSLWRSAYEDERSAFEWSGSGADLDTGIDREHWSVYAGVGGQRTSTDQPGYRQQESSLEGYASLWVRPEHLPGLFTTLTLSRYRAVYGDSAEPLRTRSFGLRAGLDLSEHLLPAELGFLPQLRASYGAIWSNSRGPDARGVELDHGPHAELAIDF